MSLYIDRKYILLASTKLERFKQDSEKVYNFRCPICGDSKKHKHKARGYFYTKPRSSNYFFKCHNCHRSWALGTFLKVFDSNLYSEYQLERYKEESSGNVKQPDFAMARTKPVFKTTLFNIPTIADLPDGHMAKEYVKGRMIPEARWTELYFAEDFKKFILEILPNCDKKLIDGEARLILPFFDEKNIFHGLQGRVFDESKVRYITIRAQEDMVKVFGLNKVDFNKPIYVVEGPIDSLFLDNAIATMDSALYRVISFLGKKDYIFVYDNEPRNENTVRALKNSIGKNDKVVIWPKWITQKDVNEMVVAGIDVKKVIAENTFQGPQAQLEFEMWRKA